MSEFIRGKRIKVNIIDSDWLLYNKDIFDSVITPFINSKNETKKFNTDMKLYCSSSNDKTLYTIHFPEEDNE